MDTISTLTFILPDSVGKQKMELFITGSWSRPSPQALALAILNGTADKMELEQREKEENE